MSTIVMKSLNVTGIKKEMKDNNLKIREYVWNQNAMIEKEADLTGEKDVIKLHLGFLVKTLSSTRMINPQELYNGRDGIVDLRKIKDRTYKLYAHETIMAYTNESIMMKKGIIMIVSGMYENMGLEVRCSQTWIGDENKGLIQFMVTNNTNEIKLLQEHCEIAKVRFLKEDKTGIKLEEINSEEINWKIIDENLELPIWENRKRSWIIKIWHSLRRSLELVRQNNSLIEIISTCINLLTLYSIFIQYIK